MGDYLPSKANKFTDIWGQKKLMVWNNLSTPLRYKDYVFANNRKEYCAIPACKPGYEPTFLADDSGTSNKLLVSL